MLRKNKSKIRIIVFLWREAYPFLTTNVLGLCEGGIFNENLQPKRKIEYNETASNEAVSPALAKPLLGVSASPFSDGSKLDN